MYLLNYYVVRPLLPLDELGLRLLPALFGVLAIAVFCLVIRRMAGSRPALWGAALLTVSSLQVYYSQLARYWTLAFLLSTICPFVSYLAMRERSRGDHVEAVEGGASVLASGRERRHHHRRRGRADPSVRQLRAGHSGQALWVVLPAPGHALRTSPRLGRLMAWMCDHRQLRNTTSTSRLYVRQYQLESYRCPVLPLS